MDFDIIFAGGMIADGTGAPLFPADVGIRGRAIAAVGRLDRSSAGRRIDIGGKVICPGFIDIHTHPDIALLRDPLLQPSTMQGVTTVVFSSCGIGLPPLAAENRNKATEIWGAVFPGTAGLARSWEGVEEYLELLDGKVAVNVAYHLPHGAVRLNATGWCERPATEAEIRSMVREIETGLDGGLFGVSTSPFYWPMNHGDDREFTAICRAVSRGGGVLSVHLRTYEAGVFQAVDEFLHLAEKTGVSLEISHLQLGDEKDWGRAPEIIARLERARERGIDVNYDSYPYPAGSTFLLSHLPSWASRGERDEIMLRLEDDSTRRRIKADMEKRGFPWHRARISTVESAANRELVGLTFPEAAGLRSKELLDFLLDILVEENLKVGFVVFSQDESDVRTFFRHPLQTVGSDSIFTEGKPHPRLYGTFPRILGKYVREEGLVPLAEAVRKMTFAPAHKLGLTDRGRIKEGLAADLVVFDPDTVADRATFDEPEQPPAGIDWVTVNGRVVIGGGKLTGQKPGRVLRRNRGE